MHDKGWIYCIAIILVGLLTGLEMFFYFLWIWLDFLGLWVWRAIIRGFQRLAGLTMVADLWCGIWGVECLLDEGLWWRVCADARTVGRARQKGSDFACLWE